MLEVTYRRQGQTPSAAALRSKSAKRSPDVPSLEGLTPSSGELSPGVTPPEARLGGGTARKHGSTAKAAGGGVTSRGVSGTFRNKPQKPGVGQTPREAQTPRGIFSNPAPVRKSNLRTASGTQRNPSSDLRTQSGPLKQSLRTQSGTLKNSIRTQSGALKTPPQNSIRTQSGALKNVPQSVGPKKSSDSLTAPAGSGKAGRSATPPKRPAAVPRIAGGIGCSSTPRKPKVAASKKPVKSKPSAAKPAASELTNEAAASQEGGDAGGGAAPAVEVRTVRLAGPHTLNTSFAVSAREAVNPGGFDHYVIFLQHDDLLVEGHVPKDLVPHVVMYTAEDDVYLKGIMKEAETNKGVHGLSEWFCEMEYSGKEGYQRPGVLRSFVEQGLMDRVMVLETRVSASKCIPENVIVVDLSCDFSADHIWDGVNTICRDLIASGKPVPEFVRGYSEITVEEREFPTNFTSFDKCLVDVGVVRPVPPVPVFSRIGSWWKRTDSSSVAFATADLPEEDAPAPNLAKRNKTGKYVLPLIFPYPDADDEDDDDEDSGDDDA